MSRVICGSEACYPELDYIPYGRQWIDEEDINAVVQVLKSPNLAQGPKIIEFEYALAQYAGAEYCAALNSGTSALHAACLAIGIKKGDEVITSANTFVASSNCVVYCGGTPIFADIDLKTYNLSHLDVEKKITARTKAVILVHFAGQSCDMQVLCSVVRKKEKQFGRKIYIIEDASHALGSCYKKAPVGNCRFSDMAVLSFHPVKHITTGEGGAVLTNSKEMYRKVCYFRSHGITGFPEELTNQPEGFEEVRNRGLMKKPWYYEQLYLGYNYRITDIQCALGISQLRKLAMFKERRRQIWDFYNRCFKNEGLLVIPYESQDADSNFHLYVVLIDFVALNKTRTEVMLALKDFGVGTQVHYIPVYTHPFYRDRFNGTWGDCPNAEKYYKKCLSLPIFPAMKDRDVRKVIESIYKVLN
ncbi:MAG: UDP-4-amino-4,6-dideoxy-N-acetyl-beta-L-altrosamine transaminase [Candidatus Omnitrophota bacterium]|nr:UDP-4-amino-4,6-dideoxy-N-acetyl-beta-L-altrosamine transaminase [Candidatus Omnitrophota bacterium]